MNPPAAYACFAPVHQPDDESWSQKYRDHARRLQASPDKALIPQLRAGQPRALHQGAKLGPHDARMHPSVEWTLGKAAIGAGYKILTPDQARKAYDPLGDELGMLDDISGVTDDTWNKQTARW